MEIGLESSLAVVAARSPRTAIVSTRFGGLPVVAAAARGQSLFALKQFFGGVAFTPIFAHCHWLSPVLRLIECRTFAWLTIV
jgi:hypothetical protein